MLMVPRSTIDAVEVHHFRFQGQFPAAHCILFYSVVHVSIKIQWMLQKQGQPCCSCCCPALWSFLPAVWIQELSVPLAELILSLINCLASFGASSLDHHFQYKHIN